jgi:hypothetical protein
MAADMYEYISCNVEIYSGIDFSVRSVHVFVFVYLESYISRSLEQLLWCAHYTDEAENSTQ